MNYSRRFEDNVSNFCGRIRLVSTQLLEDYDSGSIFCYMKNVGDFYPSVLKFNNHEDAAIRVLCDYSSEPEVVRKAEALIDFNNLVSDRVIRRILDGKTYYVARGVLFDRDKSPIIMNCFIRGAINFDRTMCFSMEVFNTPEDPVHRFILRKLIPYMVSRSYDFSFINCKAFVLKPTFQGRLDHKLVGDFLADKIFKDLDDSENTRTSERTAARLHSVGTSGTAAANTAAAHWSTSYETSSDPI